MAINPGNLVWLGPVNTSMIVAVTIDLVTGLIRHTGRNVAPESRYFYSVCYWTIRCLASPASVCIRFDPVPWLARKTGRHH